MADIVVMAIPIMKPEATSDPKITILEEEMQSIHFANYMYWKLEDAHTLVAKTEYAHRRGRLEEIHRQLGRLRSN
jgi:hypothetical protein